MLYKIYDECNIMESNKVAIFKIPFLTDMGFTLFKDSFTSDQSELVCVREPLKFSDILLTNYNYQFYR